MLTLFLLLYAYIFYPMLLQHKALGKNISFTSYSLSEELPHVAIVIPVCNEEKVIKEKLDSIFNCSYPLDKLHVYIGLDNCTDASKSIITTNFNFPNLHIIEFTERQGKPSVLNKIIANNVTAEHHLLILTDANVIFNHNTIFELVKYFKESSIGLVDGNIQAKNIDNRHEFDYWNYETLIKINESKLYSKILG
ncbi:MAG TPA: glycosyltransferase, partial [Chitinophagales bacterium]|nr:glycosyltransferase [Chitinophagales bacterium]